MGQCGLIGYWGNTYFPKPLPCRLLLLRLFLFIYLFNIPPNLPLGSHAFATFDPKHYRACLRNGPTLILSLSPQLIRH